ncbi:response regulator transcription factor [Marinobacter caseinilyticus]|uniref:response regulator transcription factor n=1 Tax=Marinobacter caseinilyticus TaxID=2692195 RepID=UPI00140CB16D|nr:response regulator transcription factor [Marinobacter caseinilyticus]
MRILLIEDDPLLGKTMVSMLQQQHTVDWIDDGQQALSATLNEHFDVIILDLSLPGKDGLEVLRSARSRGITTPIIILTARTDLDTKLKGLDSGADDYLTKPFAMEELKARIRAIIRRGDGNASTYLEIGTLKVDPAACQLSVSDHPVPLSPTEFQILYYLMRHPNQVATRRKLEDQLYGWDAGVESNALEVHIHHLRKHLGKSLIRTIRGVGYMLDSNAASTCEYL